MIEWVEIAKAVAAGLGVGLPVIGVVTLFHNERTKRFDKIEGTVNRLDADFTGLTRQLGGVVNDVEKRFLPREEHENAINRLDASINRLDSSLGTLNSHLFDLARGGLRAP